MTLMNVPHPDDENMKGHLVAHETDHGPKVKIPIVFGKIQSCDKRQKRTSSRRTSCRKGNGGEEPDSLKRRK